MSEVKKVPEIRFAGFAEPWEQRKLLDCIQKITDFRGRTPKKLGMDWSDSGYLALSALNVKDGYIDFSQDVHYGNQALYDKWMVGNELHEGQVLFTTEAPMGNVAQVPDNKRYILSQRTIAFDVRENVITENFLAAVLKSPAVFETLTALSSGGTAKGVSQRSLTAVDITLPRDLDEQSQLATVFSKINNLLTLYQRMLDRLVILKQAMLKKMFPQNGSNVPEVRFAGFTGPWEQRKLGDILRTLSFKLYLKAPEQDGKFEIIQQGNDPIIGFANGEPCDDFKNTVIFGDHTLSLFKPKRPFFVATDGVRILQGINGMDGNYLLSLLERNRPKSEGYKRYYSILADREIFFTDNSDEQTQIGSYFRQLDNIITLHQRKHESLKHVKAALLQKMFV